MPVTDVIRRPVGPRGRARIYRAAMCALALAALCAGAADAWARDRDDGRRNQNQNSNQNWNSDRDDRGRGNDNGGGGNGNGGFGGGSGSSGGGGFGGGSSGNSGGSSGNSGGQGNWSGGSSANSGGGNGDRGGGNDRRSGGFDSGFLNSGADAPKLGFGFSNSSASVSASIPLGGGGARERSSERPVLSIPLTGGHGGGASVSGGGAFSGHGGDGRVSNGRVANSSTNTLSGHTITTPPQILSARANPSALRAPLAGGPPPFPGLAGLALEPRSFTAPPAWEHRFVQDEVVLGVPSTLSPQALDALARRHGLAPVDSYERSLFGTTLHRWRITDQRSVADVIRGLEADAGVQMAQPSYRFVLAQQLGAPTSQPADGFAVQYTPAKLHLRQAHALTRGEPTVVAVIDTGIDRLHPEIAGAVVASFDAVGATEPPDAHGTGIAGAIVARGRLTGVAPAARLLAIRAFTVTGADAEATTLTIVRSIDWAVAQGARIVNMSFAGPRDPEIARSIASARRRGVVLVAAAGNDGPRAPAPYPAADPNVIAVTATDVDDRLLDVSNRGRHVAIAAPGVDILVPAPGARYQIATGTSFAAAHVSGIAALLIARDPRLTPDAVRSALLANARDLGPRGRDDQFGAGLADAYKALTSLPEGPQTVAAAPGQ